MFTREDYLEYFKQIASIEEEMFFRLQEGLKLIDDAGIKSQIKAVADDEARHCAYMKEIMGSIDENYNK
jgi:rubrerythrin